MEPPGPRPPRRRPRQLTAARPAPAVTIPWRLAAAVAAALVYVTSAGDAFVPAALLLVGAGPWAGAAAGLAAASLVARWGTADLATIAGDQDVLGPAVATGPFLGAVASALGALALLALAGHGRTERDAGLERLAVAAAAGVGAALLACGPAPTSLADAAARTAAAVAGIAIAIVGPWAAVPRWVATVLGAAALAAAVLA